MRHIICRSCIRHVSVLEIVSRVLSFRSSWTVNIDDTGSRLRLVPTIESSYVQTKRCRVVAASCTHFSPVIQTNIPSLLARLAICVCNRQPQHPTPSTPTRHVGKPEIRQTHSLARQRITKNPQNKKHALYPKQVSKHKHPETPTHRSSLCYPTNQYQYRVLGLYKRITSCP